MKNDRNFHHNFDQGSRGSRWRTKRTNAVAKTSDSFSRGFVALALFDNIIGAEL